MNVIKDYIEVLFLQVPLTEQTLQVKNDLLNTAEDHYEGLIAEGISDKEAIGIVISEFGSIDDILIALELDKVVPEVEEEAEAYQTGADALTLDDVETYWGEMRTHTLSISIGLAIAALGCACLPFVAYGHGGIETVLAFLLTFFLWAVGLVVMTTNYFEYRKKTKQIRTFVIPYDVFEYTQQKMEGYRKSFITGLTLGLISFVFSLPLMMLFFGVMNSSFGAVVFFLCCGIGSFLILYVSLIQLEYKRIANLYLKKGEPARRPKKEVASFNNNIFWGSTLIIYFLFSFMSEAWFFSWIIFLFGFVISEFLKQRARKGRAVENGDV